MAKALKIVGVVVAVVAIVASAGAALAPALAATATTAATAGGALGLSAAALATIGTVAGLAAAGIGIASSVLFAPTFTNQGNPQQFQTNPQSGLPYAIGRTRNSGLRIYAATSRSPGYNKADDLLWFGVMLSAGGQIDGIEKFTADNELITFTPAGAANGKYFSWMEQVVWAGGLMASALAISMNHGSPPGWTSAHKLSGITHALWGLRYDAKDGAYYSAGVPMPAWIGRWVRIYDPRLDSTYPGGSGSCRPLQENTYVWSRNPALHALTWALGRWQNSKRTLGIGAPLANIRVSDFVEAANVADANNWGCGGVEYSTDSKWDVLKRMLQAGGAIPTMTGAMIGCRVNKPRISVATIRATDLLDEFSGAVTKPRRDRFNAVIPRYRSESHEWEVISASPVSVPAYVTQDGGIRQKEIDYPLVQAEVGQGAYNGERQAGQLAAYDIVNSREAGPIKWTTGPKFIGLKTGDCVTLEVPEEGYVNQPVIITSVSLDPSSGKISFTAETETNSKHAFALGTSAVPPPPFALTPPDLTPPIPDAANWTISAEMTNDGLPLIRLRGGVDTPAWDRVIVQYRRSPSGDWTNAGIYDDHGTTLVDISGIDGNAPYALRIAYQKGNITGGWLEFPGAVTPYADIRLNPRGNYASGTTYYPGDAVVWSSGTGATGNSYKRISSGPTTGVAPSDGSKWTLLAIRGDQGQDGIPGSVPTLVIDNAGGGTMAVAGDTVTKGGTNGFNASVYSQESYGAFYLRAIAATNSANRVGVTGAGSAPNAAPGHRFALNSAAGGDLIYHNGASVWGGDILDGAVMEMVGDQRAVRYYVDGALVYTGATNVAGPFRLCVSINTAGVSVGGLRFSPSGAAGEAGLSIAELTIYRRAASAPATPAGGSYNFATKVLTPPSGWTSTWPSAGTDPVWAASGVAAIAGQSGTATPTWMGVGQAAANGTNGADGQAANIIFRRSAAQPAVPSASTGTPTGWYDTTGTVPAGPDPIWASFGTRPSSSASYSWQTPKRVEGVDGADGISPETTGPTAYAVPCNADGTPRAGALTAAAGTMRLRDAHTGVITSGVSGFIVYAVSNCTATINSTTGAYTFATITDDKATATFGCVYGGKTYMLTVSLNKVRDGKSSSADSDSATITNLTAGNYPSPDNEHADVDIIVPPGQTLTVAGTFTYASVPSGPSSYFSARIKVTTQNISDGGSETDLAAADGTTASSAYVIIDQWGGGYFTSTAGAANCSGTITNTSGSGKLYRLRVYVMRHLGTTGGTGTVTISGSVA